MLRNTGFRLGVLILLMGAIPAHGEVGSRPHVIVIGVNGMGGMSSSPVVTRRAS
jgi:hypothetical protein